MSVVVVVVVVGGSLVAPPRSFLLSLRAFAFQESPSSGVLDRKMVTGRPSQA